MMSNRMRIVVAAMTVVLLLTPALIRSDRHADRTAINDISLKLPPASTIGPEQQSYSPTRFEKEKQLRHTSFSSPSHYTQGLPPVNTAPRNAAYPGMTPAELDKLAKIRQTKSIIQPAPSRQLPEPTPTIENVSRTPGIDGLTPQERAKLEDHLGRQQ